MRSTRRRWHIFSDTRSSSSNNNSKMKMRFPPVSDYDARARPRHTAAADLPYYFLPGGAVQDLVQPADPGAVGAPHVPPHRHRAVREGDAAASLEPGVAVCVQPPHGAGPGHHLRTARGGAGCWTTISPTICATGRRTWRRCWRRAATCREPFLLRFSALFADRVVAVDARQGTYYGVHGEGMQVAGPLLRLHEPEARLPGHLPALSLHSYWLWKQHVWETRYSKKNAPATSSRGQEVYGCIDSLPWLRASNIRMPPSRGPNNMLTALACRNQQRPSIHIATRKHNSPSIIL
jgi:hypothetical protein